MGWDGNECRIADATIYIYVEWRGYGEFEQAIGRRRALVICRISWDWER
jgi:hypothetical protein